MEMEMTHFRALDTDANSSADLAYLLSYTFDAEVLGYCKCNQNILVSASNFTSR